MEPSGYSPVSAAANLRRATLISAILGVVALVVLSLAGHPLMAVFGILGLGLGSVNNRMLQQEVLRFGADASVTRKKFSRGVFIRLITVTVIALAIGLLLRPDGLAVFAGIAIFQILMLVGAAVPVFRSLRPTA